MMGKGVMIKILVGFIIITALLLAGCRSTATPIPERSLSEMPSQPPDGISGADSIGDPYIPSLGNTGYDVQHYTLNMAFSSHVDVITATVTVASIVTTDKLGRMSLDFSGYQVDGVHVDNSYAPYYRSADKLYIDLPRSFSKGSELVVKVSYHGGVTPKKSENMPMFPMGLQTFAGKDLTFALSEPNGAHDWYPCNDHPLDKADFRFELSVPKGLTAIANGTLLQTDTSDRQDTYLWSEPAPMATYLATVLVGNYQRLDAPVGGDVKIRHYVFKDDFDFSTELAKTQSMLQYYSDLIGPYPFDEFGYIVTLTGYNESSVAMETQTMVMMSRDVMLDPQVEGILAHEMAHQWFGDSVSLASWNEVWLKEGMAQYLMLMWLDHQGIIDIPSLMGSWEEALLNPGNRVDQPLNQPLESDMYGNNTYLKGAWVFHMLRQEIGEEKFSSFLHKYYQRFAGASASAADLQKLAEEFSAKDLSAFFQEWVYGAGIPDLNVTWTDLPGNVSVQVCQATTGQIYTFPLEIQLNEGEGKSEQQTIQIDQNQEQVTYSVGAPVTELMVDSGQKVLADVSITNVDALSGCTP